MPARGRRSGALSRGGTARSRMGRGDESLHDHRQDDDRPPTRKARRAAGDRDDPRGRLSDLMEPATPDARLLAWQRTSCGTTLLYSGMFLLLGTIVVVVIYAFTSVGSVVHVSAGVEAKPFPVGSPGALVVPDIVHQQRSADQGRLLTASWLVLVVTAIGAAVLGWFIAGRVLRPLRQMTEHGPHDLGAQPRRPAGAHRPRQRVQATRRYARRPPRPPAGIVSGATALRRQRVARAPHPAHRRPNPPCRSPSPTRTQAPSELRATCEAPACIRPRAGARARGAAHARLHREEASSSASPSTSRSSPGRPRAHRRRRS